MAIRLLKKSKPTDPTPAPQASEQAQPSEADLDAVAAEEQAKEATTPKASPLATAPATPEVEEQTSAPGSAPDSMPGPASHLEPHPEMDFADRKRDTTKKDSLGSEKLDPYQSGPKGDVLPPDVQTDGQRQAAADEREAKMRKNMGSTVDIDSTGRKKGRFAVTPQGFDSHGARIPDKVDTSQLVEAHPVHVGPRGVGAPQDSFHGTRPVKK